MRDPYSVLGVLSSADERAIKKAFRNLAKQYHPDTNENDPKARERFAEINNAYEILGDKEKRAQYDRGEIDALGRSKFSGFHQGAGRSGEFAGFDFAHSHRQGASRHGFSGFNPDNIFEEFFSGFASNGNPSGGQARSSFGFSARQGNPSGRARSSDRNDVPVDKVLMAWVSLEHLCGREKLRLKVPGGNIIDVQLPYGVSDGQKIRLKGKGTRGPGGVLGDLLVKINIVPHKLFKAEGFDVILDLPITLYEAVLGAKITIPTLDGKASLNIPAGASSGKMLRLRGKGLSKSKDVRGDMLVRLLIHLPEGGHSGLEALMRDWRDVESYKVRPPEFD